MSVELKKLIATSPSTASTVASSEIIAKLDRYDSLLIYAALQGATGGVLDVYVQTYIHAREAESAGLWIDYAHFPQLADGAAASKRVWSVARNAQVTTLTTVGATADGVTPVPALAANTILGGEWGSRWRFVFVAGSGTTAGASQELWVSGSPSQSR